MTNLTDLRCGWCIALTNVYQPITRWGFLLTSEELPKQQPAEISEQQAAKN